jgi:ERCC4-type nuclease
MVIEVVGPSTSRLRVMRCGRAVVREWKIPKPVALVDTREQCPFPLAANHPNWIGGERRATLATGDYTVEGMEEVLALERKSLSDAVQSTMSGRARFIRSCERLAAYRWKAILIEATYEEMKTPYLLDGEAEQAAHPNAVCGTLDAIEAKFGIPVLYTSRIHDLATERAASWLSKHFTYWWLEQNGHRRLLVDADHL